MEISRILNSRGGGLYPLCAYLRGEGLSVRGGLIYKALRLVKICSIFVPGMCSLMFTTLYLSQGHKFSFST